MAVTDANFETVTPAALLSTNSLVALAAIDTGPWLSLAYTIKVITNSVDWTVFGANAADYSDEQVVKAEAAVAAAAKDTYAAAQAPYRYYRVKIKSTTPGSHGTATVVGIAKAS
jgi:hypothetical protein